MIMKTTGYRFEKRWFMLDYARMRSFDRTEMTLLLDVLGRCGYNGIGLYLEGSYAVPGIPGTPRTGSLTQEDADLLKEECAKRGLFLFPMSNSVYHMENYLCQERYDDLRDPGPHERYQLRFEDPAAADFVLTRLRGVQTMFGASLVHIGGDEAILPPERLEPYARFVAGLCRTLLAEGVTPAIWGDLFWAHPELTDLLPRETVIFDWYYNGHRRESLHFFKGQGFTEVYPCPCDDSFTHFINAQLYQATDPVPVGPGEIEAFLQDGADEGCTGAVMTHWEDINGHILWSSLLPIARAGLFLSGKWDPDTDEGEQVEPLLFGHMTPYTQITHLLRDTVTNRTAERYPAHFPSHAIWRGDLARMVLTKPAGFWQDCIESYPKARAALPLLDAWQPAGAVEALVKDAMVTILAEVEASLAMLLVADGRRLWHEAALAQFENGPDSRFTAPQTELLRRIREAEDACRRAGETFLHAIRNTGISDQPLRFQRRVLALLQGVYDRVRICRDDPALRQIALPTWYELVTDWEFTEGGTVDE